MKYFKRLETYKASNVTYDPKTEIANSYNWWQFVKRIEGKLVFNNYNYSISTCKHQSKVRSLLNDLGIKIDVILAAPKGLQFYNDLETLYIDAEEHLCITYLEQKIKAQSRYENQKHKKVKAKLENLLENEYCFRDYSIHSSDRFTHVNDIAVHQLVDANDMESDIENALHSFSRDGFSKILFYI